VWNSTGSDVNQPLSFSDRSCDLIVLFQTAPRWLCPPAPREAPRAGDQGYPDRVAMGKSAPVGDVPFVALGELEQFGVGGEAGLEFLPRGLAFGRDVLGRPVALMGPVALQHVAGDGRLVDFVDSVRDAHRRGRGVHRLDRR